MPEVLLIRPIEIGALERHFRDSFNGMLASLGLGGAEPTVAENRTWHPMDHTEPPYCPYVDSTVLWVERPLARVELRYERSHWNDTEIAQATVSMFVKDATGHAMISGHTTEFSIPVTALTVVGSLPPGIAAVVDSLRVETS